MWNQTKALFQYRSPSYPDFRFYYMPLTRFQQKRYRQGYNGFVNTYEFMQDLLRDRLVLVREDVLRDQFVYAWPEEPEIQDHLFNRLPRALVIEAGAVVLGWMREMDEDETGFVDRVVGDLKEAML